MWHPSMTSLLTAHTLFGSWPLVTCWLCVSVCTVVTIGHPLYTSKWPTCTYAPKAEYALRQLACAI